MPDKNKGQRSWLNSVSTTNIFAALIFLDIVKAVELHPNNTSEISSRLLP